MEKLNRRYLRSTILWIVGILAVLLYAALATVETAENHNNLALVRAADLIGYSLVALLFAFLSLVLKGNNNRTVNIVAGAIFAVITLIAFIDSRHLQSGTLCCRTGIWRNFLACPQDPQNALIFVPS
ncbi:MAG: hypothetical protein TUN42_07985 [Dehalogenimonas sp.]